MLSFLDHNFGWIDSNEKAYAIYLAFYKAFDRVDDYIPLQKMRRFGVGESLLKLIASYLRNRVQPVKVRNYFSEDLSVISGFQ